MRVPILFLAVFFFCLNTFGQGNYIAGGSEMANFGTTDLTVVGASGWKTERSASPGYFSAVGTAVYSGVSDVYNIDGYVKHYASASNQGFVFPVGTGSDLRALQTSGTIASGSTFATAWISGDPNSITDPTDAASHSRTSTGSGILSVSPVGQWDWLDLSSTGAGVTISVSIPDVTSFAIASTLRLVGWNGSQWVNLGTAGATGTTENSVLTGTMINGITALAIGSTSFALPVKLESFSGKANGCGATLTWISASELNVSHFEMEQSSDGITYTKIASIPARNSNSTETYQYAMPNQSEKAYYRLKMVDIDGTFEYSPVRQVVVNCGVSQILRIYPNPAQPGKDILTISFGSAQRSNAAIRLISATGQVILERKISVTPGLNTQQLNVPQLSAGTYYILLMGTDGKVIAKEKLLFAHH